MVEDVEYHGHRYDCRYQPLHPSTTIIIIIIVIMFTSTRTSPTLTTTTAAASPGQKMPSPVQKLCSQSPLLLLLLLMP